MEQSMTQYQGLSTIEVAQRLAAHGYNELASAQKPHTIITITTEALREPMILLLLIAGMIYFILGNATDAITLLIFVLVIVAILIFQQQKTSHVLAALRDLTSPRALVIREGQIQRIAGRDIVVDDLLVLKEGDRVAADALLLSCHDLRVDEALLTGESIPVYKTKGEAYVYAGTMVTQGQGVAKVIATGIHTEIGKIGQTTKEITPEQTPLQYTINRLVKKLIIVGIGLCSAIVLIYVISRHSWLDGILAGITMAMAILPEEIPLILTVFFALGAWRMSKQQVLTRAIPAVEALGATTVLCVDKTGTLTLNQMHVNTLIDANGQSQQLDDNHHIPLDKVFHELATYSILASEVDPFDAMEKAFHQLTTRYDPDTLALHPLRRMVHEYELTSDLLVMTHVWQIPEQHDYIVASKGAPEAIFQLCQLDAAVQEKLLAQAYAMAEKGLRVLAVAKATHPQQPWPNTPHGFDFSYVGLVGLADPIRPCAIDAIQSCHTAGIRVIMITGDYAPTALAIAKQLNIQQADNVISGHDIDQMGPTVLAQKINTCNVFCRILPMQKLAIINALKTNQEIVAMTGDGVNDAPALKAAHIGIAMGQRGTDVAREASALVLLNDDFSSIVTAIKIGRRIFNNMQKAIAYIFAIHIPIAGLSFIPLLFGWPLLFSPIHIAFLQLIIDPACSIAFEAEPAESTIMQQPPRRSQFSLLTRREFILSMLQGIIILMIIVGMYTAALYMHKSENEARALAFTTLVIANISLILSNRSWTQLMFRTFTRANPAIWWIMAGAILFIALSLIIPGIRNMFHFAPLSMVEILLCILLGICSVIWFEIYKIVRRTTNVVCATES